MSEDLLNLPAPPPDKRVTYGSDPNQFIDLRLPFQRGSSTSPLVINFHGGFWRAKYTLDHANHFCAELAAGGIATANVEYRRAGNKGGGWPGTFADIRSAYHFMVQNCASYSLDSDQVLVMGHSAGGQLALCVAAHEPNVKAVLSLAGVVDLRRAYELHLSNDAVVDFLGGTPNEVPEHYREADPMQLPIPKARQWLIHGSADETVPPTFSREYVSAKETGASREDAHLLEIAAADHFDLIDPRSSAWKQVRDAILRLLAWSFTSWALPARH